MFAGVTIDLKKTLPFIYLSEDFETGLFQTQMTDGRQILLKVEIHTEEMDFLPNVYNLAFGPMRKNGSIDDQIQLAHKDYSVVFSTILFQASIYLQANPSRFIGIDGSSNERARLYHYLLQRNYDYLNNYFNFFGIKYYVRITRFGKFQYENPFDFKDITSGSIPIVKGANMPAQMYNYFTIRLNADLKQ